MATNNAVNGWKQSVGSGTPNGTAAGNVGDQYFDNVAFILYQCSSAGSSSTAVWTQQGGNTAITEISVNAASSLNVAGTYNNGTGGIGATFTYTSTGLQNVDSQPMVLNGLYLYPTQTTSLQNGVYQCTTLGATGINTVVTRVAPFNTPSGFNANILIRVLAGTNWGSSSWLSTLTQTSLGTNAVRFAFIPLSVAPTTSGSGVGLVNNSYVSGNGATSPVFLGVNAGFVVSSGASLSIQLSPLVPQTITASSSSLSPNTNNYVNGSGIASTLTFPPLSTVGTTIGVRLIGTATGFTIAQNAGQQIIYGTQKTTVGTGGSLGTTAAGNCVTLECIVANLTWQVVASQGNLAVV